MNNTLTIPKTLMVGFQNRKDTYTGKLAYVVYIDTKGKLRKSGSWENWKDKKIPVEEHQNNPTSGFVLNRDVGGARHSYGWNARIEKVRVYDPRGFEFEISIPNLLFILQECSAIKGKGLEGEFVYSWSGPELVLLPTTAQEYQASLAYGQLQTEKVCKSDMEIGCAYLTKKKETVVYMGQYAWWGHPSTYPPDNYKAGRRRYVFAKITTNAKYDEERSYILDDGFTKLARKLGVSNQYSEIHDILMKSCLVSKPARFLTKPCTVRPRDPGGYSWYGFVACLEDNGNLVRGTVVDRFFDYRRNSSQISLANCSILSLVDGKINTTSTSWTKVFSSKEEAIRFCKSVIVECENGAQSTIINCSFN